jgi:TonB family protein
VDPNAAAAVRSTPPPPEIPTAARENSKRGIAQIRVALSDTGEVTGAAVEGSSGSGALDQIALDFAKGATYSPALAQCRAVAGSYLFKVKFTTP